MLGHEGRQVEPLDVVAVPVERPVPLPYQPENWLIADRPWRHLRTVGIGDSQDLLEQAEYNESTLFGTPHDALNSEGVPSDGISDSLALVRVERPILFRKSRWGRSPQIRARFEFSHNRYDLAVTFEHELDEDEAGRQSASNWWFTVSLGEEFEVGLDVLHYKLVAGALRIPADSP
ncbi:MAG: hypothetical protein OXG52_05115 [bacterium]|nr:hypothetical protein [bacterium]